MSRKGIEEEAKNRNIEFLCHFTRIENVADIAREGLISRAELNRNGRDGNFNDEYRLDRQDGSICCSVSFTNYSLFYRFRMNIACAGWVVLLLKPDVLWEKDCAFSIENAASSSISHIPIDSRKGVDAFRAMFDEWEGGPSRAALGITEACPTNPQAEVLVLETIEPHYFLGFATCNQSNADQINTHLGKQLSGYLSWFFERRKDWEYWR